ncbi:hypothetical protein OGR47_12085 [Methylocystis sp. MJC1]|jgi:hypothetical protein|uniref:hypothetical protein n=1 Tax=Methylocystis sp. MJC1 TaxID=2654282 RepID=UPI0013EA186B|nr:hypothetical protein [Methylocystis sp. MJC1]KAF2990823.1 hypothetical protein MJC1_01920 [Methylocystis sp. MJC1]MBU6527718.1 hypothetical protein [Methylocystis sp. MJC1]UZX10654.1 hypothetical protein OGR47_12085 [Methylocystis sp. MJC1]
MTERLALQYSDNSFGVLAEGVTLEKAHEERRLIDENERRPEHLTRIVRVSLTLVETLFDPTIPPAAKKPERYAQCKRLVPEEP